MGEWKKVRIGEFLTESKEEAINSDSSRRITVRLNCRGVEHRKLKAEKDGATKYYIRHAGQFIYGKQNIHKGAFGIIPKELEGFTSSADLPAFDFINDLCFPEFLNLWLQVDERYKALQKNVKGAGSQRLAVSAFLDEEISLPDLPTQKQIVKRISENLKRVNELAKEIETQKGYVKLLRRNILQDAIEGKLTADWRKDHPVQKGNPDYDAEALFELIQTERKVDKKRKALPPLLDAEKPFELSTGWKWVRLGEISESCLGKMLDGIKNQGMPRKYLRNLNVRWFDFDLSDLLEMKIRDEELSRYSVKKGDLLIFEGGYPGRSAIWNESYSICFQKAIHRVHFFSMADMSIIFNYYLFYLCETNQIERYLTGEGIKHLTGVKLKQMIITLAPSQEQAEIVSRMKKLLLEVEQLEKEITQREEYTNQLMRSILQEAFEEKCGLILHF